jgi:hypothetical protein
MDCRPQYFGRSISSYAGKGSESKSSIGGIVPGLVTTSLIPVAPDQAGDMPQIPPVKMSPNDLLERQFPLPLQPPHSRPCPRAPWRRRT